MRNRNGDSIAFLNALTSASIIQVNWHWSLTSRQPNTIAYDNLQQVMTATHRDWAVTEHMTLNGTDFHPDEVPAILRSTMRLGTLFGWEFVNIAPSSGDAFSLYNDDLSPKPLMAEVDNHWAEWMTEVQAAQAARDAAKK